MITVDTSKREANIYGAALVYAPSYSSPEIWTTLNRRYVGGKPLHEHIEIVRARVEYDNAIRAIGIYGQMEVAGIRYRGHSAREYAEEAQRAGAPIRSVINAWNLARTVQGEKPADIYEPDRETIGRIFENGLLIDFLEQRS